jgi:transcriptional regulator with XRE-family HTH domain
LTQGRFHNPRGGRRRRKAAALRAENVLWLHVEAGLTYAQIGEKLGITRQRVGQIINAALQDSAERRVELAELLLVRELELNRAQARAAAEIIRTKCVVCHGNSKKSQSCASCGRTGYQYPVEKRFAAMDREMRLQERRIKLLGLDGRPYLALVESEKLREFYEPLKQIPDDVLTAEIERLFGADNGEGRGED